jgi:hypothetical protein
MRRPSDSGGIYTKNVGWSHRECVYRKWECSLPEQGVSLMITLLITDEMAKTIEYLLLHNVLRILV